jgi:hypothetical protein
MQWIGDFTQGDVPLFYQQDVVRCMGVAKVADRQHRLRREWARWAEFTY